MKMAQKTFFIFIYCKYTKAQKNSQKVNVFEQYTVFLGQWINCFAGIPIS